MTNPLNALTDEIEKALDAWRGCTAINPASQKGCSREDCKGPWQQCRMRAEYIAGCVLGLALPMTDAALPETGAGKWEPKPPATWFVFLKQFVDGEGNIPREQLPVIARLLADPPAPTREALRALTEETK